MTGRLLPMLWSGKPIRDDIWLDIRKVRGTWPLEIWLKCCCLREQQMEMPRGGIKFGFSKLKEAQVRLLWKIRSKATAWGQIVWGLIAQRPLAFIFKVRWKTIGIFAKLGVIGPDLQSDCGGVGMRGKRKQENSKDCGRLSRVVLGTK